MIAQLPEPVIAVFAAIGVVSILGVVGGALAWLAVETVEAITRRLARRRTQPEVDR